jgi:DNA mismatch repair protein MutS2
MPRFTVGTHVQTPLGKGIVREIRNRDQLLIEVNGRAMVLDERNMQPLDTPRTSKRNRTTISAPERRSPLRDRSGPIASMEIDLHGLTVEEALVRAEQAVNDGLLADAAELRLIHGRSGGRIRAALHRRLSAIPSVRAFRLDPHNEGVTVVTF